MAKILQLLKHDGWSLSSSGDHENCNCEPVSGSSFDTEISLVLFKHDSELLFNMEAYSHHCQKNKHFN